MAAIMGFISAHMRFLWEGARYQIVGSLVSTVNGGSFYLDVASDVLRLRFTLDKGELFLDFRRPDGDPDEWHSVDLIRRWFTGRRDTSGLLDESYAEFVGENLVAIEELFSGRNWPSAHAQLEQLALQRAREMFGRFGRRDGDLVAGNPIGTSSPPSCAGEPARRAEDFYSEEAPWCPLRTVTS